MNGGYGAKELRSAYSIPASGGTGQTVALIDAYSYPNAESDLAKYRETYGLEACTKANGCFKKVNEKGEEANYPKESEEFEQKLLEGDWRLESALDLDMVSAVCPHCHILLVEATTQEPKDTAASATEAAKLSATEISNSYGYPENNETYCPGKKGCSEYLSSYDHAGIPVMVSAGDSGYDNGVGAPSWPATSPNVIAVGGTTLRRAKNARGWSESVWFDSGGGCSLYEAKPKWQTDKGCAKRTDNDIAAVANPETPVSIYEGGWSLVGGTSVALPLTAAIEAHANSATKEAAAEAFYKKPSMTFDITEGDNGSCTPPEEDAYLCTAKVGYDGPTGWGTPNGVFNLKGWVGRPIPNLSAQTDAKKSSLLGVACPAGESCVAVGAYVDSAGVEVPLAEHWNGTAWAVEEAPEVNKGSLAGVGCGSSSACTAVGHYTNAAGVEVPLAEHWDGAGWSLLETTVPSGAKSASLSSVACRLVTEGFEEVEECTAAGRYVNSSGTEVTLIEHGDNGRWAVAETPNPTGAKGSSLAGIACEEFSGTQACMAVGHDINSTGTEVTLAELWLGGTAKWAISETPNPAGAKSGGLLSVSCPGSCLAVGRYVNSSGTEVTLAEAWPLLEKWSLQEPANPTGAKSSRLSGVWCKTIESCEAVGRYVNSSGTEVTLGEGLSVKTWSVQETPNPSGAKSGGLSGIACSTIEACTAAGSYLNSSSAEAPVAERWGSTKKWALQEASIPKNPSGSLPGVSCTSSEACTTIGHALNAGGTEVTLAERWNGKEWTLQEALNPTGAKSSSLSGVSCASSTSCVAVGRYVNGSSVEVTLAEVWNGTAWSLKEPLNPTGAKGSSLSGISCKTSEACMAVGRYVSSSGTEVALAEHWNGKEWSLKEPVNPTGAKSASLSGVSCATTEACIAVGHYVNSAGTEVTLGESWSGTAWSLKEPANPTGAKSSSLTGVSCSSSASCVAVGHFVNSSGVEVTLGESWSGTAWSLKEPANPTGAKSSSLSGVSCATSECTAVGHYVNSSGAEVTLAESWSGTAWSIQETPNPEEKSSSLAGVSCASATACLASGNSVDAGGLETALAEEHS